MLGSLVCVSPLCLLNDYFEFPSMRHSDDTSSCLWGPPGTVWTVIESELTWKMEATEYCPQSSSQMPSTLSLSSTVLILSLFIPAAVQLRCKTMQWLCSLLDATIKNCSNVEKM